MQKGDVVVGEVGLLDEGGWWSLWVTLGEPPWRVPVACLAIFGLLLNKVGDQ